MLIFIENTPRAYAWGSIDALPHMLGTSPTGEPQAELWLGDHPGSPASVAKATPAKQTLIDLIESDPDRYGVDGGPLPFLFKVLAIGAPLSLQVHPDPEQAAAGFAAEEEAGVPRDAPERNYGDPRHKPELLVALSRVTALSGFRSLEDARRDILALALAARAAGDEPGATALGAVAERLVRADVPGADDGARDEDGRLRKEFLRWAFGGEPEVSAALHALRGLVAELPAAADGAEGDGGDQGSDPAPDQAPEDIDPARFASLRYLLTAYPDDPGVLVSLLLHLVTLEPGEAVYLRARQIHAYQSGIAVEVMAASDNVLRAGLTQKHVDIAELCRIVDTDELEEPRFPSERLAPGLVAWRPGVPDFQLLRATLCEREDERWGRDAAPRVEVSAEHPLVLVVTAGKVRVERAADLAEVAFARHGQSLYVSAGEPIRLEGHGEVFIATVGP